MVCFMKAARGSALVFATVALLLCCAGAAQADHRTEELMAAAPRGSNLLSPLDNADLTDLLEADLDERFRGVASKSATARRRSLQQGSNSAAPTPSPTGSSASFSSSTPRGGIDFSSGAPTASPTQGMGGGSRGIDFMTGAPTMMGGVSSMIRGIGGSGADMLEMSDAPTSAPTSAPTASPSMMGEGGEGGEGGSPRDVSAGVRGGAGAGVVAAVAAAVGAAVVVVLGA